MTESDPSRGSDGGADVDTAEPAPETESVGDADEAAWDEGVEDLPGVAEAWDSVVEDAPKHAGGDDLGDRIEYDVSRGGVQRALVWVTTALAVVLALALVVTMLRNDSSDDPEPAAEGSADQAPPQAPPPDDSEDILINPAVDLDYTAVLDEVVALEEGDDPEEDRIVLDVEDSDLPAPSGSITAALVFFDGRPQVLMVGPARWLNSACIQTTVVTAALESVDAAYHDTPTGACAAAGIGRQAHVSCVGDDVIMLDLDLVDAGATSGSERLVADSVRVGVVDFPDGFESVSLLGTVDLPDDFSVTNLPLARAPLGSELVVTFPSPEGDVEATCITR